MRQNCKTFWYTLSSKTLFTSRCYAESILCTYLPIPKYGNIVWGNTYTTRLEPIRRLQKKIVRIITFSKFTEPTVPLFKELLISPLDDINNEVIALFMFRYFENNLTSSFNDFFCLEKDVHQYNTRSSTNDHTIQARTNYEKEFQCGITCQNL